ncbi:MAG: IS200/IS605 family transposase [Gemmataceae bacterium]|nr:IS200/IS605 family transposase [Gemmataceae bacterium]
MPQSLAAIYCHIVFSTKGREPWIGPGLEERLFAYIGGIVGERKSVLLAAGGMPDHVHLLVSMGGTKAVCDLVRDIKCVSSGWIHETFPDDLGHFDWQDGNGAFSVSASGLADVKAYLANQKTRHAEQSFQDEYRALLRKHEIAFDERYVWD